MTDQPDVKRDPLNPDTTTLMILGSIAVHAEEYIEMRDRAIRTEQQRKDFVKEIEEYALYERLRIKYEGRATNTGATASSDNKKEE